MAECERGLPWINIAPDSDVIARPLGLHYNHYVSLSVRYQLVKMFITLEPNSSQLLNLMVYLYEIMHTYLFLYCSATGVHNGGKGLPSII